MSPEQGTFKVGDVEGRRWERQVVGRVGRCCCQTHGQQDECVEDKDDNTMPACFQVRLRSVDKVLCLTGMGDEASSLVLFPNGDRGRCPSGR